MSKKKKDLEALIDLMHEWCVKYGESRVSVCILPSPYSMGTLAGMANISQQSPDYIDCELYKKYDSPAAGTAEESR